MSKKTLFEDNNWNYPKKSTQSPNILINVGSDIIYPAQFILVKEFNRKNG